jgi:hypothetical protein
MIKLIGSDVQYGTSRKCIQNFGPKMMQGEQLQDGCVD